MPIEGPHSTSYVLEMAMFVQFVRYSRKNYRMYLIRIFDIQKNKGQGRDDLDDNWQTDFIFQPAYVR